MDIFFFFFQCFLSVKICLDWFGIRKKVCESTAGLQGWRGAPERALKHTPRYKEILLDARFYLLASEQAPI